MALSLHILRSFNLSPKHTSLSHTLESTMLLCFSYLFMFLNLIHHSKTSIIITQTRFFTQNSKIPKSKSQFGRNYFFKFDPSLAPFFFFKKKKIKSNPHIASAHSYTHFNRFTSTNFDQNFEILKLGIRGCVAIL